MTDIAIRVALAKGSFHLDVDLTVPASGLTAVFGPSGAGKTTLLRCIAGLESAARGLVRIGAAIWQDASTFVPPHRRAAGLVFQDTRLFAHLSVAANLDYGRRRIPADRPVPGRDDVIDLLGLGALLERRTSGLSGGEAQRVAIGRALLASPDFLLLDEPLAAVDAARKGEILPFVERLHRSAAIPMLLVSHDVEDVARLADRVVLLDAGRVRGQGAPTAMLATSAPDAAWAVTLPASVVPGGRTGTSLRVAARDVAVFLDPPGPSSALAVLPAAVRAVDGAAEGQALLTLDANGVRLLALVRQDVLERHGLGLGSIVHAVIHHATPA
ncbi:MAG: molybdenum ABC transporter ATP-binding protein [Alphaproteobacteria bacterium]|nr:molybdenum ABC transporter ATP-binding protein [Alphaproteobacteria bacterium]